MNFDFSKITEWLNLQPRLLLSLMLFTGTFLVSPSEWLDTLGIKDLRDNHRQWIGLIFLGSTAFLGSYGIEKSWKFSKEFYQDKQVTKARENQIKTLTPQEKLILRQYIANRESTQYFNMSDGVVNGLIAKGILYRASTIGHYTTFPFNIQPWAWEYLNQNTDCLN